MAKTPDFDVKAAHEYFSTHCFNDAWALIGKSDRTAEENERMIQLSQASLWHWGQREDCTSRNNSVGYWQASRIYALLGQADNARRYGQLILDAGQGEAPFYVGFAYEALARAESVAGDSAKMHEYLARAWEQADAVTDKDEKQMLTADLDTIK